MKKILYPLGVIGIISMVFFFLLPLTIVSAKTNPDPGPDPKVWVCKYSGTPGENEFLKPGKQPIVVSSNAAVGTYFSDAQGRSYVLDIQTPENTGSGNSYIGEFTCPGGDIPTPEIKNLNLTFMQPCKPVEGFPDQAEWRVRNPNDFSVDYTVKKAGDGIILSGEAPAGDSFFYTPWGTQTLILIWEGGSKTKAGGDSYNGTICPEPVEHISIDKTSVPTCVEGGIEVIYTITITNDGDLKTTVYGVTDTLDSEVNCAQVSEITKGGVCDSGEITWGKFTLDKGEDGVGTYKVFVSEEDYGTYTNTVSAMYGAKLEATDSLEEELYCEIEEPTYCEETIDGDTVWSAWVIDPNDDTQEMRTGTISLWDAEDNTHSCGTRTVTEYRPIEDEGDVLGESDEQGEVLGTSIVSADTAGGDSLIISLVEFILVILSAVSINYTLKKKLQLK